MKFLRNVSDTAASDDVFSILEEAREIFPEDAAVHLFLVRYYLNQGQLQDAESLLYSRNYPDSYKDTVEILESRINQLKKQENVTIVHFTPGERKIPVSVILNEGVTVPFVIDTGATMTTIPPAFAEKMGIRVDDLSARKKFYSASGEYVAPVMTLDSLAIDQLVVHNLTVAVVELPFDDHLGLLGMDVLGQFKMNINNETGLLTLEPK